LREMTVPPAGAPLDSAAVQEVVALEPKVVAAQCSDVIDTAVTRDIPVWALRPFNDAVRVADSLLLKLPAVTVKVALVPLGGIVSEPGTMRSGVLDVIVTIAPVLPTLPLRLSVQLDVPLGPKAPPLQESELTPVTV